MEIVTSSHYIKNPLVGSIQTETQINFRKQNAKHSVVSIC